MLFSLGHSIYVAETLLLFNICLPFLHVFFRDNMIDDILANLFYKENGTFNFLIEWPLWEL